MKKLIILICMVVVVTGFTLKMGNVDPKEVKTAIDKSLPLLQKTTNTFLVNSGGCHSCHGEGLGGIAAGMAKEKGFAIQETIRMQLLDSVQKNYRENIHYSIQNSDPAAILIASGYDLWSFDVNKVKRDKSMELVAKNILQRQTKEGNWFVPNPRPPLEYYNFSGTAMAIRNLPIFLPQALQKDLPERIAKAQQWLLKTVPEANEEKVFQLLGLKWSGADSRLIIEKSKLLIRSQRADGGWSQLDSLPSDAYATGQALYALIETGAVNKNDEVYQKGIAYLLKTQYADGSWNVQTRSYPAVPYVETGFPHGENEFISAAGTNWAVIALLTYASSR